MCPARRWSNVKSAVRDRMGAMHDPMIKETEMTAVKNIPALIGGAAVLAAIAIGLTAPVATAKWNLAGYVNCLKTATSDMECCLISGGKWTEATKQCGIPADGVMEQVTETSTPNPFTVGTLATVATNAPVAPTPGRGGIFVTPSGGVAAP
jgi:hypothetical protein